MIGVRMYTAILDDDTGNPRAWVLTAGAHRMLWDYLARMEQEALALPCETFGVELSGESDEESSGEDDE